MNYKEISHLLAKLSDENYEAFIKGLISFEKGIDDEKLLNSLYQEYMDNDGITLLNDKFDVLINRLK